MSLVFDALRHVEASTGGAAMAASAPAPVASRRPRRAWALSLAALPAVALAGYLLAGPGEAGAADPAVAAGAAQVGDAAGSAPWPTEADGFALVDLTRAAAPASRAGPLVAREIVAPETPGTAAVQAAVPVAADAAGRPPEIHAAATRQHASALPAAPRTAAAEPAEPVLPAAVTPLPAERPPGRISIEVTRAAPATAAGAPRADAASVRPTVAAIERAVAAGDVAAAELHLDTLSGLLHEDSLTLLRMRAWVASVRGDADEAELGYRRILQRVPDDANAAVNVARFEAGRGEIDRARGRLTRLSGRHPGSAQVRSAMAELEAMAR